MKTITVLTLLPAFLIVAEPRPLESSPPEPRRPKTSTQSPLESTPPQANHTPEEEPSHGTVTPPSTMPTEPSRPQFDRNLSPADIDYDEQWLSLVGPGSFFNYSEEITLSTIKEWRKLADRSSRAETQADRDKALYQLVEDQTLMIYVYADAHIEALLPTFRSAKFTGSPVDQLIRHSLIRLMEGKTKGESIEPREGRLVAAITRISARRALLRGYFSRAFSKITVAQDGEYRVNPKVIVVHYNEETEETQEINGAEWIDRELKKVGPANWAQFTERQPDPARKRYRAVLRYYKRPRNNPSANDQTRSEEHGHYSGQELREEVRGLSPREQQLALPTLQPILDKCIACHVMETKSQYVSTLETLKFAMRSGEYGTFQKKILPMMSNANTVHIHFNPDEIETVGRVYRRTQEDENLGTAPDVFPAPVGPEERAFAPNTARGRALKNPLITSALMRCLVCHKDPQSSGTETVNTLSRLRARMRTIDKDTVNDMIDRGYKHDRLIHIQDVPGFKLKDALLRFSELPPDFPYVSEE